MERAQIAQSGQMSECERFAQVAQDNEQLWANPSGRSKCERFVQVAQDKWVNEQINLFFEQIALFFVFR